MPDAPEQKQHAGLNCILAIALIAVCGIALDQITKVVAFRALAEHESRFALGGIVEFHEQHNRGAAFGILRSVHGSAAILTVTTVATLVLLAFLFHRYARTHFVTGTVALGLIYGGAVGNGIDRVAFGTVRDFLALHLRLFDWPAFNVADVMIVSGIVLLLIGLLMTPAAHRAPKPAPTPEPEADQTSAGPAEGSRKEA